MEGQHHQHEEGKDIADTSHQLGAPQLLEGAETQQGAHGALSGICDQGVVGGRVHDRWLLGSRHPASLARSFVTRSARPNIRPSGPVQNRPTPTIGVTLALHATRAHLRTPGDPWPTRTTALHRFTRATPRCLTWAPAPSLASLTLRDRSLKSTCPSHA
ncbi:hypothetical protein GCM10010295_22930 [Streptomyces intermedius]